MNKTASETRRANLQLLLESQFDGNQAALARAIEKPSTDISRYLTDKKWGRNIGPRTARLIEDKCGKPTGWLDVYRGPAAYPRLNELFEEAKEVDPEGLEEALSFWLAGKRK